VSVAKRYAERLPTQHEHAREIRQAYGYRDLSDPDAAAGLREFPDSQIVPKGGAGGRGGRFAELAAMWLSSLWRRLNLTSSLTWTQCGPVLL
jgi:hypothetical protein